MNAKQYRGLVIGKQAAYHGTILNSSHQIGQNSMMKTLPFLALTFVAFAGAAQAACYADYKAKQDNPLRLHYGVAEVDGNCTKRNARRQIEDRIAADSWTLLNVLDVFDDDGLEERKDSAGEYFLRY